MKIDMKKIYNCIIFDKVDGYFYLFIRNPKTELNKLIVMVVDLFGPLLLASLFGLLMFTVVGALLAYRIIYIFNLDYYCVFI